jgi:hypothetical protein
MKTAGNLKTLIHDDKKNPLTTKAQLATSQLNGRVLLQKLTLASQLDNFPAF